MPWPSVPDALTVEPSRFARRVWHDQLVLQSTVELSLLRFLTEPRYSGCPQTTTTEMTTTAAISKA